MTPPALSLRERNHLAAMRAIQEQAVALIEEDGFDATSVERIAAASGVSPSTIYRNFGTKEQLILWEDAAYVEAIDAELAAQLSTEAPLAAFRSVVVTRYTHRDDRALFIRRLKLIYATPPVWAMAAQQDRIAREELAIGVAMTAGRAKANMADRIVAAVCLTALDVALETWQALDGAQPLDTLFDQAVEGIRQLA